MHEAENMSLGSNSRRILKQHMVTSCRIMLAVRLEEFFLSGWLDKPKDVQSSRVTTAEAKFVAAWCTWNSLHLKITSFGPRIFANPKRHT